MRQRSGRQRILLVILSLAVAVAFSACDASGTPGTASNGPGGTSAGQTPASGQTPTPTPTATHAPAPTATPTPIPVTSCAQVSGFASAGSIGAGSTFSEVKFPANTVGFVKQKFETNSYQFELISACTKATTTGNVHAYYSTGLPGVGFLQSSTYPYQGNASAACGDPYCWYKDGSHPSFQARRYVSLESVTGVGSVVTYTLRLAIAPLTRTTTIKGTFYYDFDLVSNDDVWWNQVSATTRHLDPENGAKIVNIGAINFNNETYAQLAGLAYSTTPIDGSDGTSKLVTGDVFAVKTDIGHYVKVLVTGYNSSTHDLSLKYVLYDFTFYAPVS